MSKRKFIAVILPNFSDRFQREYWPGIHTAAGERKVHPVYFLGSFTLLRNFYGGIGHYSEKTIIYKLAEVPIFNAYFLNQTLKLFMSDKEFNHYLSLYKNRPVITTSSDPIDAYVVSAYNYQGMKELVEHFIKVHGCKTVAFVKGSNRQFDSKERFRAYCDTLAENNIELNDDYVFDGDFSEKSGMQVTRKIFKNRLPLPDAIICGNDSMAFGVLEELNKQGIKVPNDVKVGGFDNVSDAEFSLPPLTSVSQVLDKITYSAMNSLVDLLENKDVSKIQKISCPLIIRESCGCNKKISEKIVSPEKRNNVNAMIEQFEIKILEYNFIDNFQDLKCQSRNLLDLFLEFTALEDLMEKTTSYIDSILEKKTKNNVDVRVWSEILNYLSELIEQYPYVFENEPYKYLVAVEKCKRIVYEALWRKFGLPGKEQMDTDWEAILSISQRLSASFTLNELKKNLNLVLPTLNIEYLFLVFYDQVYADINIYEFDLPEKSAMIYSFGKNGTIIKENKVFETKKFLPYNLMEKFSIDSITTVQPLHFHNEHFGYMVMNVEKSNYSFYTHESIVESVNTALKVNGIIDELKTTRNGLIQSAKMASLGTLLAGVAHEINNPLNYISTGVQAVNIFFNDLTDIMHSESDFEKVMVEFKGIQKMIGELLNNIDDGIERTSDIVKTLLTFSRDTGTKVVSCDLNNIIDTALVILHNKLDGMIDIEKKYSDLPQISGYAGRLTQLFINIIKNSLDAILDSNKCNEGKIEITTSVLEIKEIYSIVVKVKNNGPEIPPKILQHIFDPFFTTKGVESGTGLGLSISYSIAEEHDGTLTIENLDGVLYTLVLPVKKHSL